ncbi:OpgC domain-containing protein [Herbaspirillum sp. LeCh32-8]|uniref:OpgC domain-containing protein n=1 Tax=Herbaspirillum sp. LeCh32-8 TaxID=2821356 RepID=UPI001AE6B929|nr:OpgC domain-containing protein [Herbaspirillum sp. LeCh32-8]MBP0600194.1 OpgC domain-containing protein [Herbaspirillum sp. LeCh32-8]
MIKFPGPAHGGRSLEVDFFRGVVLLMIVVDHISGSMLGQFTLQRFAIFDATEVFVFLAGYATAAAYTAIADKNGDEAARWRFLQRGWQLYRSFLLTVTLMLLLGLLFTALRLHTPTLEYTDIGTFIDEPLQIGSEMIRLARQPYLSSILPMYMLFALASPLIVPSVRRRPWLAAAGSLAMWGLAPLLARFLPTVTPAGWTFNPFAWQLLFVIGVVCRLHPLKSYQREDADAALRRRKLTRVAAAVAIGFLCMRMFVEFDPGPVFKQNLSSLRVGSFMAVLWLVAMMVRQGWIRQLADHLPLVVTVGKNGLVCFVAGTMISLLADILLYLAVGGQPGRWAGLMADICAIAAMLAVGVLAQVWKDYRKRGRERRSHAAAAH